jgi:hypothetical protein
MGAPNPIVCSDATEAGAEEILMQLIKDCGVLTPIEIRLLEVIHERLTVIEETRGAASAKEAAEEVSRIWMLALGDHGGPEAFASH